MKINKAYCDKLAATKYELFSNADQLSRFVCLVVVINSS